MTRSPNRSKAAPRPMPRSLTRARRAALAVALAPALAVTLPALPAGAASTAASDATPGTGVPRAWDKDADGVLNRAELADGFRDLASDDALGWEFGADRRISSQEFSDALFDRFDVDENGAIAPEEMKAGAHAWYGDDSHDAELAEWDLDHDGETSRAEFHDGFAATDFAQDYAQKAGVDWTDDRGPDAAAFVASLFDWFDVDEDDALSPEEYARWAGRPADTAAE
ncbi:MAG: hypothetical protein VX463_12455 [Pseudomonadota bacterium]|nr:hypothetical protein [Pseudomonadota bacterium]